MEPILKIVTTMCVGMMIGTEFAVSAFINPILVQLDDSARAQATRLFARKLGTVMPFWYVLCFLLLIAEAITAPRSQMLYLAAAILIWALVIVFTLLFLVPINNRIARMESHELTGPLHRDHQKWDTLHRWRVLALCVAMVCMLIGSRV